MEKHKALWTSNEESQLLHHIRLHTTVDEIARQHGRSKNAIELRLGLLIQRKLQAGEKKKNISKDLFLPDHEIEKYVQLYEDAKQQSTESSPDWKRLEALCHRMETRLDGIEKMIHKMYKKITKKE